MTILDSYALSFVELARTIRVKLKNFTMRMEILLSLHQTCFGGDLCESTDQTCVNWKATMNHLKMEMEMELPVTEMSSQSPNAKTRPTLVMNDSSTNDLGLGYEAFFVVFRWVNPGLVAFVLSSLLARSRVHQPVSSKLLSWVFTSSLTCGSIWTVELGLVIDTPYSIELNMPYRSVEVQYVVLSLQNTPYCLEE
ncbi:hypothetical protein Tco_0591126 [Tanacetum coccineum]